MSPFSLLELTILSIVLALDQPSDAAPSAMLYLPYGDVREGDERANLSCVIDDAPDEYEPLFIRAKPSGMMEIIFINGRVHHSEKFSVSKRGEHYYSLTLWNVSRTDTAKYACKIAIPTGATSTSFVASATANLDVFYLPVRPHCSNLDGHSNLQRLPGDTSRLQCASQPGNPTVNLGWMQNGKPLGNLNTRVSNPASNAGLVISQLDITHLEGDNGAIYTCVLTSSGFPSFSRNCSVGPFISNVDSPSSSIGPFAVNMITVTRSSNGTESGSPNAIDTTIMVVAVTVTKISNASSTGFQRGVIVAIALSVIAIFIAILSFAIIVGIRSRHVLCVKTNTALADNSPDNPHMSIDNHGENSSANGENYTSLQKNTLEDKSTKLYQDLLPVPRSTNNHETDSNQCTNVGMVSLQAEESDYVVKSVSHKTMNASKNDSEDYEDVDELPGETYEEIPGKCYEEIRKTRAGISSIPAAQKPKSIVQHVYLDFTGKDGNLAAASTPDQHYQLPPVHVNSSSEILYANQTRIQDFK